MVYRPEIDGLRAIAVVSVMLFHAGFAWCSGGYVGVDIFFVISGYLITSIIINERENGRFSFVAFYERRVRRILPSLFTVLLACLLPAWLWMTPDQLVDFSKSLVAVNLFVPNVYFWQSDGYFSPAAETIPLIHAWSLGVEEQYYVVFPLLMAIVWRLGRLGMLATFFAISVFSLALSELGWRTHPTANFFFSPSRAWELLLGTLLAVELSRGVVGRHLSPWMRQSLAFAGLTLIGIGIFAYDSSTPNPSVYIVVPCIGTALVVGFADASTLVGRLLSFRIAVGIGLISYSAYLWHQPLLAFARIRSAGELGLWTKVLLMIVTLLLAWMSWKYIEQPFRDRRRYPRGRIFALSIAMTTAMVAVASVARVEQGFRDRFDAQALALLNPPNPSPECVWQPLRNADLVQQCRLGTRGVVPFFVLFGDSHAEALAGALDIQLKRMGKSGLFLTTPNCVQPAGIYEGSDRNASHVVGCKKALGEVISFVNSSPGIKAVLLAVRWTLKMFPARGNVEALAYNNGEGGVESIRYREYFAENRNGTFDQSSDAKATAVNSYVGEFAATERTVFLQYPVPEVGWNAPYRAFSLRAYTGVNAGTISTSYERFSQRNRFVYSILDALPQTNLVRLKPEAVLCNTFVKDRCVAEFKGKLFYFDDDHLNQDGADLVLTQAFWVLGSS